MRLVNTGDVLRLIYNEDNDIIKYNVVIADSCLFVAVRFEKLVPQLEFDPNAKYDLNDSIIDIRLYTNDSSVKSLESLGFVIIESNSNLPKHFKDDGDKERLKDAFQDIIASSSTMNFIKEYEQRLNSILRIIELREKVEARFNQVFKSPPKEKTKPKKETNDIHYREMREILINENFSKAARRSWNNRAYIFCVLDIIRNDECSPYSMYQSPHIYNKIIYIDSYNNGVKEYICCDADFNANDWYIISD